METLKELFEKSPLYKYKDRPYYQVDPTSRKNYTMQRLEICRKVAEMESEKLGTVCKFVAEQRGSCFTNIYKAVIKQILLNVKNEEHYELTKTLKNMSNKKLQLAEAKKEMQKNKLAERAERARKSQEARQEQKDRTEQKKEELLQKALVNAKETGNIITIYKASTGEVLRYEHIMRKTNYDKGFTQQNYSDYVLKIIQK
jgi:hypothetical protein